MAFLPKISATFNPVNKSLSLEDTTEFYDVTTNPEGWGAPNPARANATCKIILLLNDEKIADIDVTTQIRASGDAVVDLGENFQGNIVKDGAYKVRYHVYDSVSSIEYRSLSASVFIYEAIMDKISKAWGKLATKTDIYNKQDLEQECIWLESNLSGLESLEHRGKEAQFLNLLRIIERRLKVNNSLIF